ncbi:MAG: hypothetical protein ACRCV9_17910 [Burkholderiaceae bacterium]
MSTLKLALRCVACVAAALLASCGDGAGGAGERSAGGTEQPPAAALFISIGTGDKIEVTSPETYAKDFNVRVTDGNGNSIVGASVAAKLIPVAYFKGRYVPGQDRWFPDLPPNTSFIGCPNEDLNFNGVLDSGEDVNNSGKLEPRIVASISFGGTNITDSTGSVALRVNYAQSFALWQFYVIEVTTSVRGTEKTGTYNFEFPILASEFQDVQTSLPNQVSPYGVVQSCTSPN